MSFNLRNSPTYVMLNAEQRMNLRNMPVYAMVKDAPGVSTRSVSVFALEQNPPAPQLRSAHVLALEAVVPASLFTSLNGLETLRAAIKKEMGVVVNDALATFGNPTATAGAYDTTVVLTANPNSDFGGTVGIQYNRYPLAEAFKGKDTSQVIGGATSVHGRLAAINTFFGLKLEPRDVVDAVLKPDTYGFTLKIASTSYLYTPNTAVYIGTVANDLAVEIEVDQMNGFEVTNSLEDWIQVTAMNGFEPAT